MKTYEGVHNGEEAQIFITDDERRYRLSPRESLKLFRHSPDGFNWGYGGSGPAQTSLALLLDALKDEDRAVDLHHRFKFRIVAGWPQGSNWKITQDEIQKICADIEGGN